MKLSCIILLYFMFSVGCSFAGETSQEIDSDKGSQVIDVALLDPMARPPWDTIDGLAELTASMLAPAAPADEKPGDAGVGGLSSARDADGGALSNDGIDGGGGVAVAFEGTEGQLCLYGERAVIGVELGGECQFPAVRSYALTCGSQRCEKDWCDREYRGPGGTLMVSGMLYCAEGSCTCRCPGTACTRDQVIYCGTAGC